MTNNQKKAQKRKISFITLFLFVIKILFYFKRRNRIRINIFNS